MNVRVLFLCLALCGPASAQGFAGLGTQAEGFAIPRLGVTPAFPKDHGVHPDYRVEWWYLTANLTGDDGRDYGVQWTLFRSALAPREGEGWESPQLWMGHAALTTPGEHFVDERLARGGVGQAGVVAEPFEAWIDDWEIKDRGEPGSVPLSALRVRAAGKAFAYDLALDATGPLVLQGQQGYSVKSSAGQASYYYSQPFYRVAGALTVAGKRVAVTGQAWLDREWSSQPLAEDQSGWDWFSLHFKGGEKLMGFHLRDSGPGFTSATWIAADGRTTAIKPGNLKLTPLKTARVAGRTLPVSWRVELPLKEVDVTTTALNAQAWMATSVPYWEGPIQFSGSHVGRGYLEMTGYE